MMSKPTYEELEQRVKELEKEAQGRGARKNDLHLKLMSESTFEGIGIHHDGVLIDANSQYFDMFGYERAELIGKQVIPLTVAPESTETLKTQMSTKSTCRYVAVGLRKDGSKFPIEIHARYIQYKNQTVRVGVIRDITERKKAELERETTLTQLRTTLDSTVDGILVVGRDREYTIFNKRFVKMWRIPDAIIQSNESERVLAFVLEQLKYPDDFLSKVEELYGDPETKSFDTLEFKDGRLFERYSRPQILEGQNIGRVWSFRDVTDRYRMEAAQRESEEKYRTILEDMEEGYYEVDLSGKFTFLNDAMCRIRGQSRDELIGVDNRNYMNPETAKAVYKYFNKVYTTGNPAKNIEWETLRADGSKRYVESSVDLMKNSEGQPIGFRGVVRDVTARKSMEEELKQAQKMESIGTLAGGIAHEFNNILGIVIGNTELALMDVPDWNPAKECLKEIRKASLRAKDVVRQIMSFARKTPFERKPLQISTIIKESLKLMRATIPTIIEIRQTISCESEMILAVPTEISQVFMNLCTNSAHAMGEEAGVLEVDLKAITLDDDSAAQYEDLKSGDYVKLTVRDTGHGIKPEILDRIFDPYFTTKDVDEGLGMGMAVVYGIVKKHDGAIKVSSEIGKGTVVEVLFPLIKETVEPEFKEESADILGGTERILFVDDEESLVKAVEQMLGRIGYEVVTKMNPMEALDLFKAEPGRFDLVITDMAMPHLTGDKLAHELIRIRKDIPVILCTGHSARIDEDRDKELSLAAYAMKPLVMRGFAITVRKVLDAAKESAQI